MKVEYKKGELMFMSCGAYSDYSIIDLYEVQKSFVYADLILKFGIKMKVDGEYYESKSYGAMGEFMERIVADGYIKKIKHTELFLGDYSRLSVLLEDMAKAKEKP